jgi:diphthine synthase
MLYLIGLGLNDEKDLSVKSVDILRKCEKVLLESYTSLYGGKIGELEKLIENKIILADRKAIETDIEVVINDAAEKDVAILIIGDPLSATTHTDLLMRCRERKVGYEIIHNAGVLNAISDTGLSLYKFGKITSIPFLTGDWKVETPYNIVKENGTGHTLVLLDLKPEENKTMSFSEGIKFLLDIEKNKEEKVFTEESLVVGCAGLGRKEAVIKFGKAKDLVNFEVEIYPQCLIVVGDLHFIEEDMLEGFKYEQKV